MTRKPPTRTQLTRRETAAARRARIIKDGGKRIDLLLERPEAEQLARLGEDATAALVSLIRAS